MGRIDSYDYELQERRERREFKFTVNFKKITTMNTILMEDNRDWDDKYPKNIFITMLAGCLVGMTVLFGLSYEFLLIVTLPFMFFYFLAFRSTYRCWKEYKYKKGQFFLITILGLLLAAGVGFGLQTLVLSFMK